MTWTEHLGETLRLAAQARLKFPDIQAPEIPLPRLTMDEYAEFLDFLLAFADPDAIRRQRELEDPYKNNPPFRIVPESGIAP